MTVPRSDNAGILDADRLRQRVRFRRLLPDPELSAVVEHYWLIDWDIVGSHCQQVVPHPCVNLVWMTGRTPTVHGIDLKLSTVDIAGNGAVFGVQFRPGGFGAFVDPPLSRWAGAEAAAIDVFGPDADLIADTVTSGDDAVRVKAVDRLLMPLRRPLRSRARSAIALAHIARTDRGLLRVEQLAAHAHLSTRALRRMFADEIGVGPKWVIQRYRVHEAIERAAGAEVDWAGLARQLGYADQAHLVRDFRRATGVPPTAYARSLRH